MLYTTAANTGLRARELASLTAGDLYLDAEPPAIVVKAAYSKRRRALELALQAVATIHLRSGKICYRA